MAASWIAQTKDQSCHRPAARRRGVRLHNWRVFGQRLRLNIERRSHLLQRRTQSHWDTKQNLITFPRRLSVFCQVRQKGHDSRTKSTLLGYGHRRPASALSSASELLQRFIATLWTITTTKISKPSIPLNQAGPAANIYRREVFHANPKSGGYWASLCCVCVSQPSDQLLSRLHAHCRTSVPSATRGRNDLLDFCTAVGDKLFA